MRDEPKDSLASTMVFLKKRLLSQLYHGQKGSKHSRESCERTKLVVPKLFIPERPNILTMAQHVRPQRRNVQGRVGSRNEATQSSKGHGPGAPYC